MSYVVHRDGTTPGHGTHVRVAHANIAKAQARRKAKRTGAPHHVSKAGDDGTYQTHSTHHPDGTDLHHEETDMPLNHAIRAILEGADVRDTLLKAEVVFEATYPGAFSGTAPWKKTSPKGYDSYLTGVNNWAFKLVDAKTKAEAVVLVAKQRANNPQVQVTLPEGIGMESLTKPTGIRQWKNVTHRTYLGTFDSMAKCREFMDRAGSVDAVRPGLDSVQGFVRTWDR